MDVPNHIKDNVRAVLLSKTDGSGVLVSNFLKDYKSILHKPLMYKDLGYQTLQELIKAMPEVCRLEFSDKDMAYRLYGISKPNTFVSSFVKRAEGSDNNDSRSRRGRGRGDDETSNGKQDLGTSLDEEWEPNMRGHYTVCFQNNKVMGLETKEVVAQHFGKVGEVVDINITKGMTFVRYNDQTFAKTALRMWGASLRLRRADENLNKRDNKNTHTENNRNTHTGNDRNTHTGNERNTHTGNDRNNANSTSTAPTKNNWSSLDTNESLRHNAPVHESSSKDNKMDSRIVNEVKQDRNGGIIQVYIGNWPTQANLHDLEEVLSQFNHSGCKLHQSKGNNMKKYGFANFTSYSEAEKLVNIMNGQTFMSRNLIVRFSDADVEKYSSAEITVNHNDQLQSRKKEGKSIEEEFEKLYVHRGHEPKVNQLSPMTKTISNDHAKKYSGGHRHMTYNSNSPSKMPPLESCMPDLEESMPDLVPVHSHNTPPYNSNTRQPAVSPIMQNLVSANKGHITSPKMPNLIPNSNNQNMRNGTLERMPDLEQISPASQSHSSHSSHSLTGQSIECVQLFISNFPYGTKEWELSKLVDPYGGHSIVIMNKNITTRSTYAFVSFDDLQQAQMAILNLDQSLFKGRRLTVAMASQEPLGITSPDASFTGNLERITCTVGGNNERMVSVEDQHYTSRVNQSLSQISPIAMANSMTPSGDRSLMVSKREDGFNLPKFTIILRDYTKMVVKLRGDDDFQFNVGQKLKVLVTHVESERFFWGQVLIDNQKGVYSNLESLQSIMKNLQSSSKTKSLVRMGRCQAPYEGDWYRAWCTHVLQKNGEMHGDIFYLDYGNRAILPLSQVFYSEPPVWTIPPLAKPFKLQTMICQPKSLENEVVVVEMVEAGCRFSNYMSTVNLDYK